jgi:hypothetical protein
MFLLCVQQLFEVSRLPFVDTTSPILLLRHIDNTADTVTSLEVRLRFRRAYKEGWYVHACRGNRR